MRRPAERGAGDLRHQPADAAVGAERRFLVTLGGRDRVDPVSVHRRDDLPPPALHTGIRCRATTAADAGRRPGGVRRRLPRLGIPRGRRRIGTARRRAAAAGHWPRPGSRRRDDQAARRRSTAPRSPTSGARRCSTRFEYRGYSWYVDVDDLPRLPRWLRPFARFDARDHFSAASRTTRCATGVDAFLAEHGDSRCRGGRITALLQARVLGYVFNPLSVFWCHDADGALRHVIAEVHNTYGSATPTCCRPANEPAARRRRGSTSRRSTTVDGHYLVRAPRPDDQPRRDDLAAPRQPAGIRRNDARRRAGRRPPSRSPAADRGAAGAVDGRRRGSASRASRCGSRRVPVVPR